MITEDEKTNFALMVLGEMKEVNRIGVRKLSGYDEILLSIFNRYEKDVIETLAGSLPYEKIDYSLIDYVGSNFHKSFRQIDVIDAPMLDSIVWKCLSESNLFWNKLKDVCLVFEGKKSVDDLYGDYSVTLVKVKK